IVAIPMWLLREQMGLLIAYIAALVFVKSVWLAVLAGWPAESNRQNQDFTRIILFIALAPVAAAVGGLLVMLVNLPPWGPCRRCHGCSPLFSWRGCSRCGRCRCRLRRSTTHRVAARISRRSPASRIVAFRTTCPQWSC